METTRRGLLALTATVAVAGCSGFGNGEDGPAESQPDDDDAGLGDAEPGEQRTVTVAVQPDPGSLREAQSEVVNALDAGELTQQEAREELARRERELLADATADAEELIGESELTHHESLPEQGVMLVEGTPAALLEFLSAPMVNALLGEQEFELARERQDATGTAPDGQLPGENDTENETDG